MQSRTIPPIKTRTRVATTTRQVARAVRPEPTDQARAQEEALEAQAERQWVQDVPNKLQRGSVGPWFTQGCSTLEDVEGNKQCEVAACAVHRAFRPPCYQNAVRLHRGESQDAVGRLSHVGQDRIPLDDAQFLPLACGTGFDPAD